MVIIKEAKKTEAYTPLVKFGDRVIDLKTFFEGIKFNLHQELTLYFCDRGKPDSIIVTASPQDVKISATDITITNRNIGMVTIIPFNTLDLSAINEVSNVNSTAYVFYLKRSRSLYYRIDVR